MQRSSGTAARFWAVVVGIVAVDFVTKAIAVVNLVPHYSVRRVVGEFVQFRLVYNPGAAFGLYLGSYSRWIFMALTFAALVVLWRLYRTTRPQDGARFTALALVCAGAVGNLVDRIRSERGVVDFIDVGVGSLRWPTFNVADMAVSVGAFLLAWVLWGEEQHAAGEVAAAATARSDAK
ncbi:MAG: signal peptidase II [Gemmatimonadaceae bacterium]